MAPPPRPPPVRAARCWSGPDQFTDDAGPATDPAAKVVRKPPATVLVAVTLAKTAAASAGTNEVNGSVAVAPGPSRPTSAPGERESSTRRGDTGVKSPRADESAVT